MSFGFDVGPLTVIFFTLFQIGLIAVIFYFVVKKAVKDAIKEVKKEKGS